MDHFVARATPKTIPIIALRRAQLKTWLKGQSKLTRGWVKTRGFKASLKRGQTLGNYQEVRARHLQETVGRYISGDL